MRLFLPVFALTSTVLFAAGQQCADPACTAKLPCGEGRPTQYGFRFLGGGCAASQLSGGLDKFISRDDEEIEECSSLLYESIVFFDSRGSILAEFENVRAPDLLVVGDKQESGPVDLFVTIYRTKGEPGGISPVVSQTIQFHSSCSSPLFLGDRFGALELVGLTKGTPDEPEQQETITCIDDIDPGDDPEDPDDGDDPTFLAGIIAFILGLCAV